MKQQNKIDWNNTEEVRRYNKKYREKNKDKIKKQRKEYRDVSKHKIKIRNKTYRDLNIENLKRYDKQRYENRVKNNICMYCGKSCANRFFCNNICKGKLQSKIQIGEGNPGWKDKIKIICQECDEEFFVSPRYKYQKYCSNKCKGISKIGKKNPNWKNGVTSLNHRIRDLRENKIWRVSVFERDKYSCVICSKIGGNLEAHHINSFNNILLKNNITSIESAKKCKELWEIKNGITVCTSCHEMIDKHRFKGVGRRPSTFFN